MFCTVHYKRIVSTVRTTYGIPKKKKLKNI